MFGLSWMHLLVLLAAGLFVLGPERLPEAAAWLGRSARQVRQFARTAQRQLEDELGPEFEEYRLPWEDLRRLRDFDPRHAIVQHLFDGDPDPLGSNGTAAPSDGRRTPSPARERPPLDP